MARYKGRHVNVTRKAVPDEEVFVVQSEEYNNLEVKKSEIIFTDEEKSKFMKEDTANNKVGEASYKTQATEDKRVADEKEAARRTQEDLDRKRYNEMSAEEKAVWDKNNAEKKAAWANQSTPVNAVVDTRAQRKAL